MIVGPSGWVHRPDVQNMDPANLDPGKLGPGNPANLLLLSANPGEDVRNLRKVVLKMVNGEWVP